MVADHWACVDRGLVLYLTTMFNSADTTYCVLCNRSVLLTGYLYDVYTLGHVANIITLNIFASRVLWITWNHAKPNLRNLNGAPTAEGGHSTERRLKNLNLASLSRESGLGLLGCGQMGSTLMGPLQKY